MNYSNYSKTFQAFIETLSPDALTAAQSKIANMRNTSIYTPFINNVDESHRFGWLRGCALEIETIVRGRWHTWQNIINRAEYIEETDLMPNLLLYPSPSTSPVNAMIKKCMNTHLTYGMDGLLFMQWIGYGLGISYFTKPNISTELWAHWYEHFDISLFLLYPGDYLSNFLLEHGRQSGRYDYYPTESNLSRLLQRLLNDDTLTTTTDSCFEPCCGAGSLLIESPSINLVAADLNYTMVQAMSINAFLYLPYLLYVPCPILNIHVSKTEKRVQRYFEFDTDTRIYHGDSILGEYSAPLSIFEEHSPAGEIYLNPVDHEKNTGLLINMKYSGRTWESLELSERIEVVVAQSRHIKIDHVITNPPFNKLHSNTKNKLAEIEESNKQFIERYKAALNRDLSHNSLLEDDGCEVLQNVI